MLAGGLGVALGCIRPPRRRRAVLVAAITAALALALRVHATVFLPALAIGLALAALARPNLLRSRFGDQLRLVLLWITSVGMWLAVPDTEAVVLALGAATVLAAAGLLLSGEPDNLSPVVIVPMAAVLVWAAADGATSAPMALAAAGSLGLLLAEPTMTAGTLTRRDAIIVGAGHALVVGWCARIAAPRADLVGVALALLALVVVAALAAGSRRLPPHTGRERFTT